MYVYAGMGATQQPSTGALVGGGAAGGAITGVMVALQSGSPLRGAAAGAGTLISALAPAAGPAAPFVLAAGAAVTLLSQMFRGCGSKCTQATEIANKAGEELTKLRDQYFAQPVRYRSSQAAFLAAFDQITDWMRQACGDPALGDPGQRCINERLVKGAPAPWCPNPGKVGCDWITVLRDPIANDTGVVDDPAGASIAAALGVSPNFPLLPVAGLALIALGLAL